jgi:phage internal scaffolding protein
MSKIVVLNPFTLDADVHSASFGLVCDDPSLTVQADVEASDINSIVRKFGITHELPYGLAVPEYADYSNIPNDYHAAMSYINESNDVFMNMPANVRSRFSNDPGLFLDFVQNPSNRDEAISLGLVPSPPTDGFPTPADPSPPAPSISA